MPLGWRLRCCVVEVDAICLAVSQISVCAQTWQAGTLHADVVTVLDTY